MLECRRDEWRLGWIIDDGASDDFCSFVGDDVVLF